MTSELTFVIGPLLSASDIGFLNRAEPDSFFLFVDGGIDAYLNLGLSLPEKYETLGDGDSSQFQMQIQLSTEKEACDLFFGLRRILFRGSEEIYILGFLGGRLDHELTSLGEIYYFSQQAKAKTIILSEKLSLHRPSSNPIQFDHQGTFSLMSLVSTNFTIFGEAKYKIESVQVQPLSSLALSNEAFGSFFVVADQCFFLYRV